MKSEPALTPVEPYNLPDGRTVAYHGDDGHAYSATRQPLAALPKDSTPAEAAPEPAAKQSSTKTKN